MRLIYEIGFTFQSAFNQHATVLLQINGLQDMEISARTALIITAYSMKSYSPNSPCITLSG